MKDYIKQFFCEFDYEESDRESLLKAYDRIVSNETAKNAFLASLELYQNDVNFDFSKVVDNCGVMSDNTGVSIFASHLITFISLTKHMQEIYAERGLPHELYHNCMLDLKYKLEECKAVRGEVGVFVTNWFYGFYRLTRFALGRLQFETVRFGRTYEKDGVKLDEESRVINVHIPRTGTPIDKESCDEAYRLASEFFADKLEGPVVFVCSSWLLFPEVRDLINPKSNVYRFTSDYEILKVSYNTGGDLWRLFDTDEKHPDRLPADSSLRRAYIAHMKRGGRLGGAYGVYVYKK